MARLGRGVPAHAIFIRPVSAGPTPKTGTDAGVEAESITLSASVVDSRTNSAAESVSLQATANTSDTGAAAESAALAVAGVDSGTAAEVAAIALTASDSAVMGYGVWPLFGALENFGDLSSDLAVATSFVAPDSVDRVTFSLSQGGSPTDQLYAVIVSDSVSGTVIATSGTVNGSSLTSQLANVTFLFPSSVGLINGATYYLRLHRTVANVSAFYDIGVLTTGGYYTGDGSTTWTFHGGAQLGFLFSESESLVPAITIQTDAATVTEGASIALAGSDSGTGADVGSSTALLTTIDVGYGATGNPNPTNSFSHVGGNSPGGMASQFTATSPLLQSLRLFVQKGGGPTGNVYVEITDGSVTGTVIGTSAQIAGSSLPGASTPTTANAVTFTFAAPVQMTVGNTYWVRFRRTTVGNQSPDYYAVSVGDPSFPFGWGASFNGTNWNLNGAGQIMAFQIPEAEAPAATLAVQTDSGIGTDSTALALTASDSGSVANITSIATSDVDSAAAAEGGYSVGLASADAATLDDTNAVVTTGSININASDSGLMSEGPYTISQTVLEVGVIDESAVSSVTLTAIDAGSGVEAVGAISTSAIDAGSDAENISLQATANTSDTGSATESAELALASSDLASESDVLALAATGATSDAGVGADAGSDIALSTQDSGTGSDTSSIATSGSDSGATTDSPSIAAMATTADSAAATESATIASSDADAGSASEAVSLAAILVASDSAAVADGTTSAALSGSDSSASTDSATTEAALATSDAGAGSDSTSVIAAVNGTESGSSSESAQPYLLGMNKLPPDAIVTDTNLTGPVADIQDDPDAADAQWITSTAGANAATDIRTSFPTPPGTGETLVTGAGQQEFRILLRLS